MARIANVVLALAVFAAVGVILLNPVAGIVDGTTGTQSVTNETVTADYNSSSDLEGYDINTGTVTVYGFNDSSSSYEVAESSGNYTVLEGPGEIEFNSSSTLIDEGEEVKVSYEYTAAGSIATLVIGFIPVAIGLLVFVGLANGVQRELQL